MARKQVRCARHGRPSASGDRCRAEALERRALLSVSFTAGGDFGVGHQPFGIAVADLGNGHADVVAANGADDTVSVLLGNGRGSFAPQQTYATGSGPSAIAVADLGNGHPDLVVANSGDGTVSVLLGTGSGTFAAQQTYAAGSGPSAIAVADLGNGHPDLVVANSGDDTVSVLLGDGSGTFGTQRTYAAGGAPLSVVAADLGNGHVDLVVADYNDDTVSVLLGVGDGTFLARSSLAAGTAPYKVVVADVTGDGHPDVVVANTGSQIAGSRGVGVLPGHGDGAFGTPQVVSADILPHDLAVADFGNGHPDIVESDGNGNDLVLILANGDGTFSPGGTFAITGLGAGLAAADINGDGQVDIVAANQESFSGVGNTVSVLLNVTAGSTPTPTPTATKQLRFATEPVTAAAADTLPPVTVAVTDAAGAPLVTDASRVTVSVASGPAGGTLSGTTTVTAIHGVAVFADLSVAVTGTYTLTATAAGAATGTSTSFPVASAASAGPGRPVGGLDPRFGTGGLASHNVGFTSTNGVAADGVGSVLIGPIGASPNRKFGITRYNADGSLDTSFGTAGVTATPFAGGDAVPTALAVLASGQVLVAGTVTTFANGVATGSEFAVARYTAAGALDATFGTGGTTAFGFGAAASADVLRTMAVDPGGRIYLGGRSDAAGKGNADFAVAALTSAGALDPAFNATGKTLVDIAGGDDALAALAVQAGAVVAAGSAVVGGATDVALVRVLATGTQDLHFGTKGVTTSSVGGVYDAAQTITLQPKGQLLVGGVTASGSGDALTTSFLVQRYTAKGKLDPSFGTKGTAVTSFGQPAAVSQLVLLADGSVIASGRTSATIGGTLDVAIARYTSRGVLNLGFNGTGKVVIRLSGGVAASTVRRAAAAAVDLGAAFDAFTASQQGVVAVTAGGEILVAGNSGANTVEAEVVAAGVDLVAAVLASSVPATGVGGLKGTATITVTNSGTDKATGTITIALQFATDAGGSNAVTAKTYAQPSGLLPGKGHAYKLSFNYPLGLAAGGYYLVSTVAGGTGLAAEVHAANNFAAGPSPVTIAPAVVTLSGSALAAAPVALGKPAKVLITLTNGGNVTAKGTVAIDLYLSTDGTIATGVKLTVPALAVNLGAGKSRVVHLSATLPASVAAGTFTLLAVVDLSRGLGVIDQTDPTALVTGGSVTVG